MKVSLTEKQLFHFQNRPYFESDSTFTHNGELYDLNEVFLLIADKPTQEFQVKDLIWILQWDTPDPTRMAQADLTTPIVITLSQGQLVVLDGLHRLAEANKEGHSTIEGKFISNDELIYAKRQEI